MLGKQFAGFGQHHAARQPLEQRRADVFFELADLPADGGHGNVQVLRSRGERPRARDFDEVAQGDSVQHVSPPKIALPFRQA